MQTYKCQCGNVVVNSSTPPPRCSGCDECKTRPAPLHAELFDEPWPHEYTAHAVDTDDGLKARSYCRFCYKRKKDLERGF